MEEGQAGVLNILASRIIRWFRCRSFRRSLARVVTVQMERERVVVVVSPRLMARSLRIQDWAEARYREGHRGKAP